MSLYGYDWPQGGTKQVLSIDRQHHLQELVMGFSSPWQGADLAALTGAPLASGSASDWLRVVSRRHEASRVCRCTGPCD